MEKYPRSADQLTNLRAAAEQFVLPGFVPPRAFLKYSDTVWTAGSCFAENISNALALKGVNVAFTPFIEAVNSPLAMRVLVEGLRTETAIIGTPEKNAEILKIISSAAAAIITFGVGASGMNKHDKLAFSDDIDHWRPLTFAECKSDIHRIVKAVRRINPKIHVFLTLSPVPLNRSLWQTSPVVADCISKSTIRTALAEFIAERPEGVFYWPAFEIVRWIGAHRSDHYGADDGLQRHVSKQVVGTITDLFIESFFSEKK